MRRFIRNVGIGTLVAVLAVVGLSALLSALPAAAAGSQVVAAHGGGGRGFCGQAGLEAAAQALSLTADELRTQLWAGESLADLADEANVDLQAVQDAVTAACTQAARDAIEQAVTDGSITRAHADWLIEGLEAGYWGPGSNAAFGPRGFGFGPVGRGGHGPGRLPFGGGPVVPSSTPSSNT